MWQWPGQTDDKGYGHNSHACFQIPQLEFTFNIYISDCDEKAAILSRCLGIVQCDNPAHTQSVFI